MRRLSLLALMLLVFLSVTTQAQNDEEQPVNVLVPQVLNEYPHDTSAFTQGLLWHEGTFYESTGLRGQSTLREVEITTGEVSRRVDVTKGLPVQIPNLVVQLVNRVNQIIFITTQTQLDVEDLLAFSFVHAANTVSYQLNDAPLDETVSRFLWAMSRNEFADAFTLIRRVAGSDYFAEGLELVDDRLIQLTWQANVAFVYDLETFEQIDTFTYDGEGWGLCEADGLLYLSDGTDFIDVFDAETYELVDQFPVTYNGEPVRLQSAAGGLIAPQYNELECVGDKIYANAWRLDFIFAFDRNTGVLTDFIDARALLTSEERATLASGRQVLNGIAYNPDDDVFYITGKEWSKLFEVRFVPAN